MNKIAFIVFTFTFCFATSAQNNDFIEIIELDSVKAGDTAIYNVFTERVKFNQSTNYGNFLTYFKQNITYTKAIINEAPYGKCYIEFVIEPNGKLTHFKVLKGLTPHFDNECIRVLKLSEGNWECGKIYGVKVRSKMVIPFLMNKKFNSIKPPEYTSNFNHFFIHHYHQAKHHVPSLINHLKLKLIVDKNGNVKVKDIIQPIHHSIEKEIVRVLELSQWKAGQINGENVNMEVDATINILSNFVFYKHLLLSIEIN